ncbi:MAG: hypothetical protein ACRDPY_38810 [Streptosporangiaceae bacterium]
MATVAVWTVPGPPAPLSQLTAFELVHYLALLEAVRSVAPAGHPVQDDVADMIDQVRAEQDERGQAREAWPAGTWGAMVSGPGKTHGSGSRP